jgi:hypothetical protein
MHHTDNIVFQEENLNPNANFFMMIDQVRKSALVLPGSGSLRRFFLNDLPRAGFAPVEKDSNCSIAVPFSLQKFDIWQSSFFTGHIWAAVILPYL